MRILGIDPGLTQTGFGIIHAGNSNPTLLDYGIIRPPGANIPLAQRLKTIYKDIIEIIKREQATLICLAGFMRVLSETFVKQFKNRIMNIHPSLLPSFPGLKAQNKALDAGVKFSGCTVHFLDEGIDTGPIICQAVVPVLDDDTVENLSKRILKEEHHIYPLAIQAFIEQRLVCIGRKVFWKNEKNT